MGKGRFLKSAERACVSKARFDTAAEAEAISEGRFRAYLCPVCHHYHLTSGQGPVRGALPVAPAVPEVRPVLGAKLGDLDWSAALEPDKPKPVRPKVNRTPSKPKVVAPAEVILPTVQATCLEPCGKDGKVKLNLGGQLVKSKKITDPKLRQVLRRGIVVRVHLEGDTPVVIGVD